MPKADNPPQPKTCAFCGGTTETLVFATRSFGIRENDSRMHAMTNGPEPVCADILTCFKRAMRVENIKTMVKSVQEAEKTRIAAFHAERKAKEEGKSTHVDTVTVENGERRFGPRSRSKVQTSQLQRTGGKR